MAAIAGILRIDNAAEASRDVRGILGRMAHRAPDGMAYFDDAGFALAHGALRTTPESVHERQPTACGERWMLAIDGRIDNRGMVGRALGLDAATVDGIGDADLFAHAWACWGEDFWRHVVGDFAVAAWDRRERRLTLMRDRIGQRPLYFARSRALFAFASEPEPLLGLDGVSNACDEDALAYLLAENFQGDDMAATFYRDVRRLRPGEVLRATTADDVRVERYWRMQPGELLRLRDPGEYVDAFREVFGEAVHCRLRTLRRPAVMLSGGIDSASVLASARLSRSDGMEQRLLPISAVADHSLTCEESSNIMRMHAGGDGLLLPVPSFSGVVPLDEVSRAVWDRAHPIDNSLVLPRIVYQAARHAGSNVVLDGIDGDLVMLTGDGYAGDLLVAGRPLRAIREARLATQVNTYLQGVSPLRILAYGVARRLEPAWLSAWRYHANDRRRGDDVLGPLIDRDFARRLRLRERSRSMAVADRRRRAFSGPLEDLAYTWENPGFSRGMEGFDRTAGGFGVEARHPWCDQRVVEFFLQLPDEYKVRDGWTKWIARAAWAPELGREVAWHSGKEHLGFDVTQRVLEKSPAKVSMLLEEGSQSLAGVVDAKSLARLQAAWGGGVAPVDAADYDDVLQIATLAAWIGRYRLRVG